MNNAKLHLGAATLLLMMCGVGSSANAAPIGAMSDIASVVDGTRSVKRVEYVEERGCYYSRYREVGGGCGRHYGCDGDYESYPRHKRHYGDYDGYHSGYYSGHYGGYYEGSYGGSYGNGYHHRGYRGDCD